MEYSVTDKINLTIRIRVANCYTKNIFLYNCEIWTITNTLEGIIDVIQPTLLRRTLENIKWGALQDYQCRVLVSNHHHQMHEVFGSLLKLP